jgi:hypothetical protein
MGFLYANATSTTQALLGTMLREKLHQLQLREVKFYNDQRILNEQLLRVRAGLVLELVLSAVTYPCDAVSAKLPCRCACCHS